ncbi:hypothetical protein Halha_1682 [Halobacteroides halobius DSM 5150]|uniref:Uncharacterized protein n=1 Tax=Halobacteroides halobius (strain ATCC 35273 / DSM 5150 / MD-1) TaxID=748449 RepID=L0KB59_HALHC|nr:nickel-dependent lactate racemase [Halobacteroides halobius]AGB41619.1 hypothetical protein Halha_1682 [Halobacteroides halobius DSM 5150]
MKLKYGAEKVELDLDRLSQPKVLLPNEEDGLSNPQRAVKASLEDPINSLPIEELAVRKEAKEVVIVVNDVSRPTPYDTLLPPLLEKLHQAGLEKEEITFVVATGIHEPHTDKQNRDIYGTKIVDNYQVVSHNPDHGLVDLGKLSSGNRLYVNQKVVEADLLITIGVIAPHYFAGFSGGRKSILPGVAGRDTIEYNHSRMVNLIGDLPKIEKNPISQEMIEGANKVGVDFILNVVTNSKQEIVEVVAGDLEEAWRKGTKTSAQMYHVSLEEKADLAVVSAGGYPKDINIYQAQKALDNANAGVKKGGTIILLAECRAGLGEDVFEEWLNDATKPEDNIERIKQKFVLGGHKAFAISKVVLDKEFILISEFNQEVTDALFATKAESLDQALEQANKQYNKDYKTIVMPQGGLTVPVLCD